jgi:type IV pilus assembly protein PilC
MKFKYKAVTEDSKRIRGLVEAKDEKGAASYLRKRNLTPVHLEEDKEIPFIKKLPFRGKVKSKDLVIFTRQLSSMLSSGLTLIKSLEIIKDQIGNTVFKETIGGCLLDLEEGKNFSTSIAKYPEIFSSVYVSLVAAGEKSGLLDKVFLRLAENLEKQQKLRNKVKGALMYPIIVIVLMVVVMMIMLLFVIPQLKTLYDGMGAELPFITQMVLGISNFIKNAWPLLLGLSVAAIYGFLRWKKTIRGREIYDRKILGMPLFGKIIKNSILTEFSRTFGLLVGTGTLIVDALNESSGVTGNIIYEVAIDNIAKKVEKGVSVGEAMAYTSLFPPLLIQLVKVGEETGKIDENLMKASEYFEEEVNQAVKTLTTAMEPLIMIVLGIGVGFLVFSVITPIYGLLNTF